MQNRMARRCVQLQISETIRLLILIFVVNDFFNRKKPIEMSFHHKSVLVNIAILMRVRMTRNTHQDISLCINNAQHFQIVRQHAGIVSLQSATVNT